MIKLYAGGRFSGLLGDGGDQGRRRAARSPGPTASSPCARARRGGCCSSAAAPGWRRSSPAALDGRGGRRAARDLLLRRARPRPTSSTSTSSRRWPRAAGLRVRPGAVRGDDGDGWTGETGLITDVVERLEDDLAEVDAYLCGPPPMVDAAIAMLEAKGVPEAHIYFDKFTTTERSERGASMATDSPVKERSVPKPVFTDAEAGAKEFPSSHEPQLQLLHAAQAAGDGLRGRHRRRPARSRAPPDAGLGLRVRQRRRRLSAGVDGAEVLQLARVPRPQRGVGADDLPQQRERSSARSSRTSSTGGRAHVVRRAGTRAGSRVLETPRVRLGARRARHRHARLHAGPARRADEHDQQRDGGRRGAQAALRAGPDPLQPRRCPRRSRASTAPSTRQTWQEDPIWQPTREFVERLTGIRDWAEALFATAVVFEPLVGELFRSGFVMQAAAPAGRLRHADDHGRRRVRRGARAARRPRAVPDARRRRGARRARTRQTMQGWLDEWAPASRSNAGPPAAADLVAVVREGRPLRGLLRALARRASRTC